MLPEGKAITFSQLKTEAEGLKSGDFINQSLTSNNLQSLVIDNIGMLSSLYAYADVAYIGGGFGVGIHNTLEAAAFGLPVIFGPNYQKFNEAKELIAIKAGFSISNETELKDIVNTLVNDEAFYNITRKKVFNYVKENVGATDMIMKYIDK